MAGDAEQVSRSQLAKPPNEAGRLLQSDQCRRRLGQSILVTSAQQPSGGLDNRTRLGKKRGTRSNKTADQRASTSRHKCVAASRRACHEVRAFPRLKFAMRPPAVVERGVERTGQLWGRPLVPPARRGTTGCQPASPQPASVAQASRGITDEKPSPADRREAQGPGSSMPVELQAACRSSANVETSMTSPFAIGIRLVPMRPRRIVAVALWKLLKSRGVIA